MKDREERAKKPGCEGLETIAAVICYILMMLLIPAFMIVLWVGLWMAVYGAADFFMGLLGLF